MSDTSTIEYAVSRNDTRPALPRPEQFGYDFLLAFQQALAELGNFSATLAAWTDDNLVIQAHTAQTPYTMVYDWADGRVLRVRLEPTANPYDLRSAGTVFLEAALERILDLRSDALITTQVLRRHGQRGNGYTTPQRRLAA